MSVRLIIHADFEDDLNDIAAYYEARRRGLGDAFITSVDAAMDGLAEEPRLSNTSRLKTRSVRTRRFPYLIHFRIMPDHVFVFSLLHGRRGPSALRRILRERT